MKRVVIKFIDFKYFPNIQTNKYMHALKLLCFSLIADATNVAVSCLLRQLSFSVAIAFQEYTQYLIVKF